MLNDRSPTWSVLSDPRAGLYHVYHVCEHIQKPGFVLNDPAVGSRTACSDAPTEHHSILYAMYTSWPLCNISEP